MGRYADYNSENASVISINRVEEGSYCKVLFLHRLFLEAEHDPKLARSESPMMTRVDEESIARKDLFSHRSCFEAECGF